MRKNPRLKHFVLVEAGGARARKHQQLREFLHVEDLLARFLDLMGTGAYSPDQDIEPGEVFCPRARVNIDKTIIE
jgi:hypothetical protein